MNFTRDEFRLRDISARAIVRHITVHPGQTRADLIARLALPRSTVISLVHRLLHDGWLMEREGAWARQRGRRSAELHLRPDRLMLLGVELGVQGVRAVAISLTGEMLAEAACEHGENPTATGALDTAVRLLLDIRKRSERQDHQVAGIGIGVPGPVDEASGCTSGVPALGWGPLAVARLVKERLRGLPLEEAPLYVQNDVEVAAAGEREFGARPSGDIALGAAAFARHRIVQPFKEPTRLPTLVARYGRRYNAPAVIEEPARPREPAVEAIC
ncbi:MAG: ROK family protein [Rubrivivax sp.]|nr:MAG: ROK family protein [Rubrivivax sp.]